MKIALRARLKTRLSKLPILALFFCALTMAVIEVESLSTPELSARYRSLITEYRCPKCQNQNLAESNSPISVDLRTQIRRLLEEGADDTKISNYLVARYGEFVLYKPRVQTTTYILWLAPALLLTLALIAVFLIVRQRRTVPTVHSTQHNATNKTALDAEEQAALHALLTRTETRADSSPANTKNTEQTEPKKAKT